MIQGSLVAIVTPMHADGSVDDSVAPLRVEDTDEWWAARQRAIKAVTGEEGEVVATYNRNAGPPDISANDDIGFRCARDAQ